MTTDPLGICLVCYTELDEHADVCAPCWAEYIEACKAADAAWDDFELEGSWLEPHPQPTTTTSKEDHPW